jgi:hypothetical protein
MKMKHLVTGAVTAAVRSGSRQAARPLPGCQIKRVSGWIVEPSVDYAARHGWVTSFLLLGGGADFLDDAVFETRCEALDLSVDRHSHADGGSVRHMAIGLTLVVYCHP